ncbi:hypothetical protein [Treponema sp.]|uniref:hypothetical protein n=1 Tax=Treponema sp. TaxID=166 RepID=UPI003F0BF775
MTNQVLADLLVLALLFIGNARFLFVNHSQKDTLSILPFAGLFVSVVNIFVFTLSFENFLIFILALFSSVWNVRSVLRMFSEVILDQYEIRLISICSVNALLAALMIFAVIYFRPMNPKKMRLPVKQTSALYSGNISEGFSEVNAPFVFPGFRLFSFGPETENASGRKIILFASPETANSSLYNAFFCKLANNGFYVYAVDVLRNNCLSSETDVPLNFTRRFSALKRKIFNSAAYEEKQKKSSFAEDQFWILLSLCNPTEKDTVFLVTDEDLSGSMQSVIQKSLIKIFGCFDLAYIDGYRTKGAGPVENTDPFLASILGVQMDRSGYMSSHLGTVLSDFINTQMINEY